MESFVQTLALCYENEVESLIGERLTRSGEIKR